MPNACSFPEVGAAPFSLPLTVRYCDRRGWRAKQGRRMSRCGLRMNNSHTSSRSEETCFIVPWRSPASPTKSTGSGEANVSLDTVTHEITYDLTFSGLASDVTAAHIHGPAEPGKNAGVVVPFAKNPTSPLHGTAKLTAEQQQEMVAGMDYVNVHSKNNPNGAVRGQLTLVK